MSNDTYPILSLLESELLTCTMCGFCKNICPVFIDDRWDTAAPRGRMTLAYGLISGQLEPDDVLVNRLFQCTQCQDCLRRCPSNAACPDVILAARRELVQLKMTGEHQNALVNNIEKTGNIFADEDVQQDLKKGDFPFFIGCQYLSRPNSVKKILKFMKKIDLKPEIMNETCCGFPLHIMGFEKANSRQKEKLRKKLKFDGREIITICPSCLKQLKEEYNQPAIHLLQVIDKKLDEIHISKPVDKVVTYHDPCDLSRGAKITEEPRNILKYVGCKVVEMTYQRDTSRCCGGGGGILTWDADMSLRMSIRRIEEARKTGAEMLVTACPTCEQNLKQGAKAESVESGNSPLPVRHVLDMLIRASK
ncbi:(Fe-S)-binding protein [bacterium]|nr:(Fe-S)-binding protein [bacterium]